MTEGLSSRERHLAALRHQEPDRVPLDLRTGEGYRLPGEPWRRGPLDKVKAVRVLGGDPCRMEDIEKLRYLLRPPSGDALARWWDEAEIVKRWSRDQQLLLRARRTFCGEAGMWLMRFEDT